jgi:hypothetical protein
MERLLCIRQNHRKCNRLFDDGISTAAATTLQNTLVFKDTQSLTYCLSAEAKLIYKLIFGLQLVTVLVTSVGNTAFDIVDKHLVFSSHFNTPHKDSKL